MSVTAWRAARSLLVLQLQLQAAAPRARPSTAGGEVDPNAWGLRGDAAHTSGDHVPRDFPGWGPQIVTAADFPNRPDLGLDAHAVLDAIRRSQDPRVKYAISNDQIFSSYRVGDRPAWVWGPYNPGDPNRDRHDTHGHLSVVGDPRADDSTPWHIDEQENDMAASLGPVVMRPDDNKLVLCIPPVQAGIADPARTWLNVGIDLDGPAHLRVYQSFGTRDGWSELPGHADGLLELHSGEVFSVELDRGVRLLSVVRVPGPAAPDGAAPAPSRAAVGICFERK